eukprot:TRINITY_DN59849_c0_g1_i1.p1 TRINITY_DN59849_c0_g1~~TRINITY_DN59849_c0_g1_i1.p1  ORF type:complete len:263 (+),score=58.37 TRINITY_DN59849_c0_g1_i1:102-890(+)
MMATVKSQERQSRRQPTNHQTKLCWFFPRGRCEQGEACTFAHTCDEVRTKVRAVSKVVCKHWSQGHCRLGENCRFSHALNTEEPFSAVDWQQQQQVQAEFQACRAAISLPPPVAFQNYYFGSADGTPTSIAATAAWMSPTGSSLWSSLAEDEVDSIDMFPWTEAANIHWQPSSGDARQDAPHKGRDFQVEAVAKAVSMPLLLAQGDAVEDDAEAVEWFITISNTFIEMKAAGMPVAARRRSQSASPPLPRRRGGSMCREMLA